MRGDLQERPLLCFPKLISSLPGTNPPLPEHKIEVFVRFYPSKPLFLGLSSTKSSFLCQKGQLFTGFAPSRAQNRHFCALLPFGTAIFGHFEHKIEFFVLGKSNRGESVGRKGRVIAERAKGSRNLRDAYGAQYSKKIIFLLFIPFI